MKIPLKRAYFVFWVREDGTDKCLWGNIDELWKNLGQFALDTDVFGVFTTAKEANVEYVRQLKKGPPRG